MYLSNQDLKFEKTFCSTIGKKVLNNLIQLNYYRFPSYLICSNNKFDKFLLMALENEIFNIFLSLLLVSLSKILE